MPDIDRNPSSPAKKSSGQPAANRKAAEMLVLKSLETGDSKYANQAIRVGNLKEAYAKLGTLDRVIVNLGLQDLQSQGKPTQDPRVAYQAGQTYLHEYFSRELMNARSMRAEQQRADKIVVRGYDPGFGQGKMDLTIGEFSALINAKYQLGILAASQRGAGGGGGGDSEFMKQVNAAKARIDKKRDELGKLYEDPKKGLTPKGKSRIREEVIKLFNDPSSTFRKDWIFYYNAQQLFSGGAVDGEQRAKEVGAQLVKTPDEIFANFPVAPLMKGLFFVGNVLSNLGTGRTLAEWGVGGRTNLQMPPGLDQGLEGGPAPADVNAGTEYANQF